MRGTKSSLTVKRLLIVALMLFLMVDTQVRGQAEKDLHRPACTTARCRKIKSFLKAHYCGESPYGNGPDDGCLIRRPKSLGTGIKVIADFDCKWSESEQTSKCQQHGRPSSEIRRILLREMRRLGLPAREDQHTYFTVWGLASSGWSLAKADYNRLVGTDLTLCQIIVIIDQSLHVRVLRKVPFQKADADVPAVTTWSPLDVAGVDGDGHVDVIFEGDAYEDHWLEVDSVQDESSYTIFSGLGYYL